MRFIERGFDATHSGDYTEGGVSMTRMKWVVTGFLAAAFLAGCATTKPIWFIATPGYVEAQIATSEGATRAEYEGQIAEIQNELNRQRQVTEELAALTDVISDIERNNRELLGLADELEDRLAALPRETIRQLVEILERHLEEELPE
jgi:hypothetical protein